MLYVGIDIAKNKHDVCILDQEGNVVQNTFTIQNAKEGYGKLVTSIETCRDLTQAKEVKVGLESTGHYGHNLMNFLQKLEYQLILFNPLQVSKFRQALTLRKTKTDKLDATYIAKLTMSQDSEPMGSFYPNEELKSLTRHRSRLIDERSRQKVQLARLIDILFPELPGLFCSISQKSILALLKACPGAAAIAKTRNDKIQNILLKASKGKFDKGKEIKDLAKQSVGLESRVLSFELIQIIQAIEFLDTQITELDKELEALMDEMDSPLMTIPGIGFRLAATIHAEIGDITRFASPDKLLAFAGLEPSTYQSGKFKADRTPMTKRGSPYLRWAMLQAARLGSMYCPDLRECMHKKLAEGKHYFVAMSHVSKKLTRIIFKLLQSNEAFISQVA